MTTLSADVTDQMIKWIDSKVDKGLYKSRSEIIRELLRDKMLFEKYPLAMQSQKALQRIWDNKKDEKWEDYL